jgi:hypothetical protein
LEVFDQNDEIKEREKNIREIKRIAGEIHEDSQKIKEVNYLIEGYELCR